MKRYKRYKLTNQDLTTHNGFKWEIGKKFTTSGEYDLCSPGWLHCYSHPLLSILFNPIHADIDNPKLFEVNCSGKHLTDRGLKEGFTNMTLVKELKLPKISNIQKIAFAILCSLEVYEEGSYIKWAKDWLSDQDRSHAAARAAFSAVSVSARAAVSATAAIAAAAQAANTAAHAAYAATAAELAAKKQINFISLAKKAMLY